MMMTDLPARSAVPADLAPEVLADAPTDRQVSFLRDLLRDRVMPASATHTSAERLQLALDMLDDGRMTKKLASQTIDALLKQPRREVHDKRDANRPDYGNEPWNARVKEEGDASWFVLVNGDGAEVPRGSYAVMTAELPGDDYVNDTNFYSVWADFRGGEVRWSVKQLVSDERMQMSRKSQYAVLDVIAKDPATAAARYGLEFKKCGICGRGLTNDESRERGIGPVCAERHGW